jgi:hypothetical protein
LTKLVDGVAISKYGRERAPLVPGHDRLFRTPDLAISRSCNRSTDLLDDLGLHSGDSATLSGNAVLQLNFRLADDSADIPQGATR